MNEGGASGSNASDGAAGGPPDYSTEWWRKRKWAEFALCKGDDPNLWVIEYESAQRKRLTYLEGMLVERAKRICASCPVREACSTDVKMNPQPLQIRNGKVYWQ